MSSTMSTGQERSRVSCDSASDDVPASPESECQLALTPRPRHRSASPRDGTFEGGGGNRGCVVRGRRLTTGEVQTVDVVRRRYNSMSASITSRPMIATKAAGVDAPPRRLRVSRDATQPSTGSMRSLRSSSQESEEADEFPGDRTSTRYGVGGLPVCGRPRAATCPESKAFRRRARVRSYNRPPTPTPTPAGTDTDSPATSMDKEDECASSARLLAELRLNTAAAYVREPANGRPVVTRSPSLGNCGADLPAISESQ